MKYLASLLVLAFLLAGCTGADGIHYPHLVTAVPPLPASTPSLVPTPSPAPMCLNVKGNIDAQGRKLYHLPGMRNYNQVKIDVSKGERVFCTEQDAINAGWVKAGN